MRAGGQLVERDSVLPELRAYSGRAASKYLALTRLIAELGRSCLGPTEEATGAAWPLAVTSPFRGALDRDAIRLARDA